MLNKVKCRLAAKSVVIILVVLMVFSNSVYSQKWDQSKTVKFNTGDDCDKIVGNVSYAYLNGNSSKNTRVKFAFAAGNGSVTWWKKIEIPVKGGGYRAIEFELPSKPKDYVTVELKDLDFARKIRVHKAKLFGVKTLLNYVIDLNSLLFTSIHSNWAIYNVTFLWEKDKCGN